MEKNINKKRIILIISVAAACILLIFVACAVSLTAYLINNQENSSGGGTGELNLGLVGKKQWNGLYVDKELYDDLTSGEDEKIFKLKVWTLEIPSEFIYDGKSYGAYKEDYKQSNTMLEKLEELKNDGDDLKYGDALYNGGAPNDSSWTQERYEYKTEQYYGKALLGKYIVNGEFLLEKLEDDIASAKAQRQVCQAKISEAENEYYQEMLSLFKKVDEGATLKSGAVYFSLSKKQLSNLTLEYKGQLVYAYEHYGTAIDN